MHAVCRGLVVEPTCAAMAMPMDPGREGARVGGTDNRPVLIIERRIDGVAWVNNAESSGGGNNNSAQRAVGGSGNN